MGDAAVTGAVADALSRPDRPASLYICDDSILAACRTTRCCLHPHSRYFGRQTMLPSSDSRTTHPGFC